MTGYTRGRPEGAWVPEEKPATEAVVWERDGRGVLCRVDGILLLDGLTGEPWTMHPEKLVTLERCQAEMRRVVAGVQGARK